MKYERLKARSHGEWKNIHTQLMRRDEELPEHVRETALHNLASALQQVKPLRLGVAVVDVLITSHLWSAAKAWIEGYEEGATGR